MTGSEWLISSIAAASGFFSLIAAIGLLRFPDVYTRLHSTSKNATAGVILSMSAVFIYFAVEHNMFVGKLLLTIFFVFITAPIAALLISRSAYRVGVPLNKISVRDDMKSDYEEERNQNEKNE